MQTPMNKTRIFKNILAILALLLLTTACEEEENTDTWKLAFQATDLGWFLNIHGPTDSDTLYAVGGNPEEGLMMKRSEGEWAPVDTGYDVPLLNWTYARTSDDVFVVGNNGTILHWDDTEWTLQDSPTEQDLWGVWAAAADDVWAVGGRGQEEGQETVLHYDGTSWTAFEIPELDRPKVHAFYKVWGTGSDNVYIVGQKGAVLHWDGTDMTELHVGASGDLISLWGTGPDHIVMVGGRSHAIIVQYDGVEWTTTDIGEFPGINGVWTDNKETFHIAANEGIVAEFQASTLKYIVAQELETNLVFHAVFGGSDGFLYSVGGSLMFPNGPFEGIAIQKPKPEKG